VEWQTSSNNGTLQMRLHSSKVPRANQSSIFFMSSVSELKYSNLGAKRDEQGSRKTALHSLFMPWELSTPPPFPFVFHYLVTRQKHDLSTLDNVAQNCALVLNFFQLPLAIIPPPAFSGLLGVMQTFCTEGIINNNYLATRE
jgi:hypothetical protein